MVLRTVRADRDTDPDISDIAALTPSDGDLLRYDTDGTRYSGVQPSALSIIPTGATVGQTLAALTGDEINVKAGWGGVGAAGDTVLAADGITIVSGTDDTAAFLRAIVAAKLTTPPRPIKIPPGKYSLDARLFVGAVTSDIKFFGLDRDDCVLVFTLSDFNLAPFEFVGTITSLASATALTVAADRGDTTITVTSTAGISDGQYVVIQDPSQPVIERESGTTVCDTGQTVRVRNVLSATELELFTACEFNYPITTTKVRIIAGVHGLTFMNLGFVFTNSTDVGCFSLFRVIEPRFEYLRFKGMVGDAIRGDHCINGIFHHIEMDDFDNSDTTTPYGINLVNGSTGNSIDFVRQRGGRHLVDGGASAGNVESHNNYVGPNCLARDMYAAGFGTHSGTRGWVFDSPKTIGRTVPTAGSGAGNAHGVQIRGRYHLVNNPIGVGCDIGYYDVYGDNNRCVGGRMRACRIGASVEKAHYSQIDGLCFDDSIEDDVLIDPDGAAMPGLVLRNVRGKGSPSNASLRLAAGQTWDPDWEVSGYRTDASTPTSNVPSTVLRPAYLEFAATATLYKPSGLQGAFVEVIGAGGGGGGGARVASGTQASGGSGGGGGSRAAAWFDAADLSDETTITINATGTAGTGATSDGVAGGNGGAGGNAVFGSNLLIGYGGGGGAGGQVAGNSGGGGGAGTQGVGGSATSVTAGAAGSTGGIIGGSGATGGNNTTNAAASGSGGVNGSAGLAGGSAQADGGGGGGSGGGIASSPANTAGGNGGRCLGYYANIAGGSSANGATPADSKTGAGAGGAGGGSNAAGVGYVGGSGAPAGGGGGGGGSAVGGNGGAGGTGGAAIVRIWMFYEN